MEAGKGPDSNREETLRRLMILYKSDLMRLSYVYLKDAALAEDAVQETFIKAYQSLDRFRGASSEATWLSRIAINTCKDMKRGSWFRLFDRRVTPDQLPEPIQSFLTEEDGWLMEDILHLPDREKDVVLMYYYQGMGVQEIGEALNLRVSSVSKRVEKARRRLRGMLEGDQQDETSSNPQQPDPARHGRGPAGAGGRPLLRGAGAPADQGSGKEADTGEEATLPRAGRRPGAGAYDNDGGDRQPDERRGEGSVIRGGLHAGGRLC